MGNRENSVSKSASNVNIDPEEQEMKTKIDAKDKEEQEIIDKEVEEKKAIKNFNKLLPYNKPRILIIIGFIFSAINGVPNPLTGLILSKLFGIFPLPFEVLGVMSGMDGKEYFKQ